jgi:arylsulfatase A-like enzyme
LISPFADPEYRPESYYLTDAISDHAVRFIADRGRDHGERPFFLYVAYTSAHWPMHATPEEIAQVEGKYDAGYAPIRRARFEKAAALGLIDPKQGMSAQAGDWDKVRDKDREAACMEVYAAMVDRMDQGIGKIVAELARTKRLDNTLVVYLQDNGGCAELTGRNTTEGRVAGPRGDGPSLPAIGPEVLSSRLIPIQTRDGYPVRQGPGVVPGPSDTFVAYGEGWANVSNTPFREYKH